MKIDRPGENEYAPFYAGYVARVPETEILDDLREQPKELSRLAGSVSKEKEQFRYGEEKWSVREIYGHLVDAERFFGHRAFCVSRGDATPLPGFDEKLYVSSSGHDSRPLADLVKDFSLLREANVRLFESLEPAAFSREGVANGAKITVRALAYVMAGHVRHHLAVLNERYGIG
jgi:DinB superfamily